MIKENPTVSKMETTSLTEQWKNGELEEDFYYVKNKSYLGVEIDYYPVLHGGIKYWSDCDDEDIEEVLAPVPSYDQFVELTEKANQFSQLVKKVDEVDEKFRFIKKPNKLSKDEETALKSIIFANELETKCNCLEKENAELLEKIEELTTKCNQLAKKVKKRGMQIERAYDRYVAKRKENSELVQKIHILNEANMSLENTVGKLGEQLNEANRVIKHYADGSIYLFPTWYNGSFEANNYLEKWGVK